eukprot:TRINITY_DN743_c9_g1_i1.p1 TRINITY_DN743_c9_g1~~TRINITY_DN743_c9_g1_i1.p1  ORF type:complete len:557 (+),score=137.18 TRINITY_DN743_c9_g1_i1:116-1672(+)
MESPGHLLHKKYAHSKAALITPEQRYWKQFRFPVLVRQYAPVTSITFSPTSPYDYAVSSSTRVQIFDSRTNEVRRTVSRFRDVVYGASFRHDAKLMVAGGEEGLIRVCDVNSRQVLRSLHGNGGPIHVTKFVRDSMVMSCGDDASVRLWDLSTGDELESFSGHTDRVRTGAVFESSKDTLATGSYDHSVKIWDVRSGSCSLSFDHGAPVEDLVVFPGGSIVVSAGGPVVKVWDLLRGELLETLENHQKTVTCLSLDASRSRLFTASLDRHVKVYSTDNYDVTHTMKYPSPILAFAFSPGKSHIVCGMADGMLSIRYRAVDANKNSSEVTEAVSIFESPAEATARINKGAPPPSTSVHSWKYLNRGRDATPVASDHTVAVTQSGGKPRFSRSERLMNKFQYKQALDAVLITNDPNTITSFFEELVARDALSLALSGRTSKTVLPVLTFLDRYLVSQAFVKVLLVVANAVIDIYAPVVGLSIDVDKLIRSLSRKVSEEVSIHKDLQGTLGALEALLALGT